MESKRITLSGCQMAKNQRHISLSQDKQVEHFWEVAQGLAAEQRFALVKRYREHFERLDTEFANLQATQSWLLSRSDDESAILLINYVEVLAPYLIQRGLGAILTTWCEGALRAIERLKRNPASLRLLSSEGYRILGQWDAAMADIQRALDASRNTDPSTYARALGACGRIQLSQGYYRTALETLSRAEDLLKAQSDQEELAAVRADVAAYYLLQGDLDQAISRYLEIEQSYQNASSVEPTDRTLLMLGVLYRKKRDYAQATSHLLKLFDRATKQRNQGMMATTAHHLAWVMLNQGDLNEARQLCGQAMMFYEDIDDTRGFADAQEQLGLINLAEDNVTEAIDYLERSLRTRQEMGNQHGAASSLRRLALAHYHARHLSKAIDYLYRSLMTYARLRVLKRQRIIATIRELRDWIIGQRRWTT